MWIPSITNRIQQAINPENPSFGLTLAQGKKGIKIINITHFIVGLTIPSQGLWNFLLYFIARNRKKIVKSWRTLVTLITGKVYEQSTSQVQSGKNFKLKILFKLKKVLLKCNRLQIKEQPAKELKEPLELLR